MSNNLTISSAQEIIQEIKHGRMVVLVDDENREKMCIRDSATTIKVHNSQARLGNCAICCTTQAPNTNISAAKITVRYFDKLKVAVIGRPPADIAAAFWLPVLNHASPPPAPHHLFD